MFTKVEGPDGKVLLVACIYSYLEIEYDLSPMYVIRRSRIRAVEKTTTTQQIFENGCRSIVFRAKRLG